MLKEIRFYVGKYIIYMQCHDFLNHSNICASTHSLSIVIFTHGYHYIMLWIIESINLVPFSHLALNLHYVPWEITTGLNPCRGLEPGFSKFDDLGDTLETMKP